MSDFFKELEEDIREERIMVLWHKYGNYVIGLALAIVIGTIGYTLWKYMKHKSQVKAHISFSEAVKLANQGKKEQALKAFQAIAKEGGYGKLAELYEAALLPEPEALYIQISQKNAADPALGGLSKVLRAARALNDPEAVDALEPLTSPKNAWAPLSFELLALVALKNGDETKAADYSLKMLKEPYLTHNERVRGILYLSQIDVPQSLLESEQPSEAQQ